MNKPSVYEIRIEGLISGNWSDWFEGLTIHHPAENETILRGVLSDQAASLGLLSRIHSLNLNVITMTRLSTGTHFDGNE